MPRTPSPTKRAKQEPTQTPRSSASTAGTPVQQPHSSKGIAKGKGRARNLVVSDEEEEEDENDGYDDPVEGDVKPSYRQPSGSVSPRKVSPIKSESRASPEAASRAATTSADTRDEGDGATYASVRRSVFSIIATARRTDPALAHFSMRDLKEQLLERHQRANAANARVVLDEERIRRPDMKAFLKECAIEASEAQTAPVAAQNSAGASANAGASTSRGASASASPERKVIRAAPKSSASVSPERQSSSNSARRKMEESSPVQMMHTSEAEQYSSLEDEESEDEPKGKGKAKRGKGRAASPSLSRKSSSASSKTKRKTAESTAKRRKSNDGAGASSSKSSSGGDSALAAEVVRLKAYVVACGVRKQWNSFFESKGCGNGKGKSGGDDPVMLRRQKVVLREMLAELGMVSGLELGRIELTVHVFLLSCSHHNPSLARPQRPSTEDRRAASPWKRPRRSAPSASSRWSSRTSAHCRRRPRRGSAVARRASAQNQTMMAMMMTTMGRTAHDVGASRRTTTTTRTRRLRPSRASAPRSKSARQRATRLRRSRPSSILPLAPRIDR